MFTGKHLYWSLFLRKLRPNGLQHMPLLVDFAKYLIRNNCLLKFDYSPGCGKRSKVQKAVFREKYLQVKFLFHKILLFKGTKSKLPSNQFANLKGREPYLGLHSIFSVTARWWKKTYTNIFLQQKN